MAVDCLAWIMRSTRPGIVNGVLLTSPLPPPSIPLGSAVPLLHPPFTRRSPTPTWNVFGSPLFWSVFAPFSSESDSRRPALTTVQFSTGRLCRTHEITELRGRRTHNRSRRGGNAPRGTGERRLLPGVLRTRTNVLKTNKTLYPNFHVRFNGITHAIFWRVTFIEPFYLSSSNN